MKIEKYEKYGKSKYRIFLNNGEIIETYDEVILKNELLLKKEITTLEYQKILSDSKLIEYYYDSLKYISTRIRSIKEIKDYLTRKNADDNEINIVIDRLLKEKLLDDEHFTECFIKDKINFTTMGEYKMINELKKHHISSDIISKYSYLFDKNIMIPRIEKLVEKQINSHSKLNHYQLRDKIYRYLISQGYSSDLVVQILNQRF